MQSRDCSRTRIITTSVNHLFQHQIYNITTAPEICNHFNRILKKFACLFTSLNLMPQRPPPLQLGGIRRHPSTSHLSPCSLLRRRVPVGGVREIRARLRPQETHNAPRGAALRNRLAVPPPSAQVRRDDGQRAAGQTACGSRDDRGGHGTQGGRQTSRYATKGPPLRYQNLPRGAAAGGKALLGHCVWGPVLLFNWR